MFRYKEMLEKEGISVTRSLELSMALKDLHTAMSKLDNRNRGIFNTKSVKERLYEYATVEDLNTECLR